VGFFTLSGVSPVAQLSFPFANDGWAEATFVSVPPPPPGAWTRGRKCSVFFFECVFLLTTRRTTVPSQLQSIIP